MSKSVYDDMVDNLYDGSSKPDPVEKLHVRRGKRPLKMPKNYNFSVRNVKWDSYKNDFILRTDAIWERSKLKDIFYGNYKAGFMYDSYNQRYMIANIR